MYRIKRVKEASGVTFLPPAVHYATGLASQGNVTGWTRDAEKALAIADGLVGRVREFHAGRKNAGAITFELVNSVPEPTRIVEPTASLAPTARRGRPPKTTSIEESASGN